jgi:hypothetical protein
MSMDKSFMLFPNLPTELRLKTWRLTLPLFPRVLEAKPYKPWSITTQRSRTPKWTITPTTNTTLLSINQESRNELKKFYSAPFNPDNVFPSYGSKIDFRLHCRVGPDTEPYSDIAGLRFNYEFDTLFLDITDLCYLWPRIYTFSTLLESVFGDSYPEAQQKLRSLAGSEDFWDTIVLQENELEENVLENFVSMKENIVVFAQNILSRDDILVRFEDVEEIEWAGQARLYLDQFPRVEGVLVKSCRGIGKKELRLLEVTNKWNFRSFGQVGGSSPASSGV